MTGPTGPAAGTTARRREGLCHAEASDRRTSGPTHHGEGPDALILLHGWAGSASYFDLLISHLDPDLFTCTSVDLPGHGSSAEVATPYTLDLIADAADRRRGRLSAPTPSCSSGSV